MQYARRPLGETHNRTGGLRHAVVRQLHGNYEGALSKILDRNNRKLTLFKVDVCKYNEKAMFRRVPRM